MNILKISIWSLAVIGMAPAVLLALLNLTSTIALSRHLNSEPDVDMEGIDVTTSQSYMEFGDGFHIELSSSLWPPIILLVGGVIFAAGLLYLIPAQSQIRKVGGFDQIEHHIQMLEDNPSQHSYVVMSPAGDEYTAVTVSKNNDIYAIEFFLTKKEQVAPVLDFFSQLGLEPETDSVTEKGTEFETRNLSYPVANSSEQLSKICRQVLLEAYQLDSEAELVFTMSK